MMYEKILVIDTSMEKKSRVEKCLLLAGLKRKCSFSHFRQNLFLFFREDMWNFSKISPFPHDVRNFSKSENEFLFLP
jgi:hypothetical protein